MRIDCYGVCCALSLIGFAASAAEQTTLLAPDWNAPAARRYLESTARPNRFVSALSAAAASNKTYLLPVLGLVRDFHDPNPAAGVSSSFIAANAPSVGEDWWPQCAKRDAVETPADDATGTWYTYNYDFGCIHISINGDLNSHVNVPPALREELADKRSGDQPCPRGDGPSQIVSSVCYEINRLKVPYIVEIYCAQEARAFCLDARAQRALLSRLSIVAGGPSP
jgi:hypothetical protein